MSLSDIKTTLNAKGIALVHVVAFDRQHCIGKDNQLAWHVPEDLQHFKRITTGGVVVMGRKTFESMGRALPNRINWVMTRDAHWQAEGAKVAHSLEEVLMLASSDVSTRDDKQLFIIGGGEIFRQTLAFMDALEISRIDLDVGGDAFYPEIPEGFVRVSSEHGISKNGIGYAFERYERQT